MGIIALALVFACAVVVSAVLYQAKRTTPAPHAASWNDSARAVTYHYARIDRWFRATPTVTRCLKVVTLIRSLTLEQQVAQLFVVTPESLLAGRYDDVVINAGTNTREALLERPVGGIIYFQQNLVDANQTTSMLANTRSYALEACGIAPLLAVDEEGGTVSRVGGNPGFDIANVGNMCDVGATSDAAYAAQVGLNLGDYLHHLGFSANMAPVADLYNNPDSPTMALRSFGSDPTLVGQMVAAQVQALSSQRIMACAKHFPGIGAAFGDSHDGAIYSQKTADEMAKAELVPFAAAIEADVPMIMVGHLSCPQITGSDLPASLSPAVMGDLLRDRMGFTGVIITDSLGMGAVSGRFAPDRVGVEAFLAGADLILMPTDFNAAYQGMLDAVESGEITSKRLNESLWRIVWMKQQNER